MRQQHHQPGLEAPLGLPAAHKCVLCNIVIQSSGEIHQKLMLIPLLPHQGKRERGCIYKYRNSWWAYKNDLCPIEEVSELCLPDDQVLGVLHGHPVLEGEDCLFGEDAVGNLQAAFIASLRRCRHQ